MYIYVYLYTYDMFPDIPPTTWAPVNPQCPGQTSPSDGAMAETTGAERYGGRNAAPVDGLSH